MSNLQLLTTRNFNGVAFDCYKAENEADDFWATREQIGRLLEYSDPADAIKKIHLRKSERLDKFSRGDILSRVEGGRTVTREVTVYNFKGLLEICRFSNRPKANDVMDFLWNVADEIRKNGFYATPATAEQIIANPDAFIKILEALKTEQSKVAVLEAKAEEDKPKVIFAEAVEGSKDGMLVGTFAKFLKQKGFNIGQNRLFVWFRENGWLMNTWDSRRNTPTQKALDSGYFGIRESVVITKYGTKIPKPTPLITGKGQQHFINGFLSGKFEVK